jgi:uncharacterized protein YndB with AHSA1/START domain
LLGRGLVGDGRWAGVGCGKRAPARDAGGRTGGGEHGRAVGRGGDGAAVGARTAREERVAYTWGWCVRIARAAVR